MSFSSIVYRLSWTQLFIYFSRYLLSWHYNGSISLVSNANSEVFHFIITFSLRSRSMVYMLSPQRLHHSAIKSIFHSYSTWTGSWESNGKKHQKQISHDKTHSRANVFGFRFKSMNSTVFAIFPRCRFQYFICTRIEKGALMQAKYMHCYSNTLVVEMPYVE